MRVGKRLFPYPVLNSAINYSAFSKSIFEFTYEDEQQAGYFILHNIMYNTDNEQFAELVLTNKIKVVCIVECSSTIFRKEYQIFSEPSDIKIPIHNLEGKIVVSCFAYAMEEIKAYVDSDFLEDYLGYAFNIEKFDIVACDDGYTHKITYDENEDNKVSSIFLIIKNNNEEALEKMIVEKNMRKIIIQLPEKQFNIYDRMKGNDNFKEIFFSFLVIPALTYVIETIKNRDVSDLLLEYNWFNSISIAYQNIYNEELTNDNLSKISGIELAQALMNFPVTNGIEDFFNIAMNTFNNGDEDEE